jgi:hypothetical protein
LTEAFVLSGDFEEKKTFRIYIQQWFYYQLNNWQRFIWRQKKCPPAEGWWALLVVESKNVVSVLPCNQIRSDRVFFWFYGPGQQQKQLFAPHRYQHFF